LSDNIRPNPVVLLYGNVYNGKTKEPLSASLLYESLPDGKNAGNAYSSPVDGNYKLVLPYGKFYSLRASANNFIGISENLDLTNADQYKEIRKDLYLVPIEKGQTIRLNSIFFDIGKATLREESFPELDRLLVLLQQNPKLEIEISGHTDNVGGDASNMKLSNERAEAVTTYLNYRGITVNRIIAKGYGKTKPAATNSTEEGRQLNRRVEFTILKN
jgi:outer membrane protein OmpA-like peptidoglycan-associated protein